MNLIRVYGELYRIPDSWDTFTIQGRLFRRRHAAAFVCELAMGERVIHAEFV
jgi:hypothetical protein